MKTNLFTSVLITMLFASVTFGQDVTTVTATNYDISDNLDLTAVASIFGESKDLSDFEYRLNNPKTQISNLDLNRDGQVDYLRVTESVEKNTHLIIIQSVLGRDMFQDVATIEVEKDTRNNRLQVQVVGDVFLYGSNYIYEPVYYARPIIFNTFWTRNYVVYHSPWYWGYYPTYFSYWAPCPIFRYRSHVHTYVNVYNNYNYVTVRNSSRAVAMHNSVRSNYYERQNPSQSFSSRNTGTRNSYTMNQTRSNGVTSNRENSLGTVNQSRGNSSSVATTTRGTSLNTDNSLRTNSLGTSNTTRGNSVSTTTTPTRSSSTMSSNSNRSSSVGNSSSSTSRSSSVGTSSSSSSRSSSLGTSSSSTRSSANISSGSSSSMRSSTPNTSSRNSASVGSSSSRSASSNRSSR